MKQTPAPSP